MLIAELVLAIALASLLTMLIAPLRYDIGDASWFLLFVLLTALIWAGGTWLTPIGPPAAGVNWLNFLVVSLFLLLLILVLAPRAPAGRTSGSTGGAATGTATLSGIFFWLILVLSLAAVAAYYI